MWSGLTWASSWWTRSKGSASKDKERLKEMKAGVDCLTLTATPHTPDPPTCPSSRSGDMSVLNHPRPTTASPSRLSWRSFNPELIAEAIRKEVERGGQVFYLHNRIESLDEVQTFLTSIAPEIIIETAHGQMDPSELEDIMHRFIHGGFHVLVSTTIIENGIDIPNVNTIIIDRADMYGISQLYQLRGRVGPLGPPGLRLPLLPRPPGLERARHEAAPGHLGLYRAGLGL